MNTLSTGLECSLSCYRSGSIRTIESKLQQRLNKIQVLQNSHGFKDQNQPVHFCSSGKPHDDPVLHLYSTAIYVVDQVKFSVEILIGNFEVTKICMFN